MSHDEQEKGHGQGQGHGDAHAHAHGQGHGDGHGQGHGGAGVPASDASGGASGSGGGAGGQEEEHHGEPDVVTDRPLGPPRRTVDVGAGVTFSYIDEGRGPPVVLLHGFPTSCALWRNVIPHLAKERRCIAPDLPGLGDTECPVEEDFGMDRQAELILAFLDALGLQGEVALAGHDIGCGIAQVIAAKRPERLSKLVLLNGPAPGADVPEVVIRLMRAARFAFLWDLLADTGFLRWFAHSSGGMRAGMYDPDLLPDEAIAEYVRPIYKDTPPAYRAARERFRRLVLQNPRTEQDVLARTEEGLARFEKPTLVVWGCDDPYFSPSWGKKLADLIPGCIGLELIPFCGHWVPEEKPEVLAALISSHLAAPAAAPRPEPAPAAPAVA